MVNNYAVYDGPGFLSDILKRQRIYKTSSFQCFIQILESSKSGSPTLTLNFSSKLILYQETYEVRYTSVNIIHFPNQQCQKNLCFVFLFTSQDNQVNITVNKFVTSDIYDPNCKYAGLVTVEKNEADYKESDTFCKSYDSFKPSLYSLNTSSYLLFYWYSEYSTGNVSLIINTTECKPLQINLDHIGKIGCLFYEYRLKCQHYLNSVTNKIGVQLSVMYVYGWSELAIKLTVAKCVILKLTKSLHANLFYVYAGKHHIADL